MADRKNIVQVFTETVSKFPDKTFYSRKVDGEWKGITYAEFSAKVYALAAWLEELGVKKGDKVSMLSENRVEWALTDYALLHLGAISVPVYPSLLPNQIEYIVDNCDAVLVLASNEDQADKLNSIRTNLKNVNNYVLFGGSKEGFLDFWEGLNGKMDSNANYSKAAESIGPDDLATLIYTSGTTGFPKGVMLTHYNFISNIEGGLEILEATSDDSFLSFLPLSHVFERMAGHFLPMYLGATIYYAEGIDYVAANMGEVHPTIMVSVPRLYEKMHTKVLAAVEEGSGLKKKIFHWAFEQGKKGYALRKRGMKPSGMLAFNMSLAHKLVFSKLHDKMGGKLRFFVSGGAPLSREVGEFFSYAGLYILEGYGLTETSPVIAINPLANFKMGAVGLIIPNVEVKIADDGEILTRGPHIMVGYYKNEAETKESIDSDGWFFTGDIGYIDEEKFLVITDRKKNIIVTSGGKNIAPQPIENLLVASKFIEQTVLIGDRRKYCSALIVPTMESLHSWADAQGLKFEDDEDLIKKEEVVNLIQEEIDRLSVDLASYETIKKFALIHNQFTIESGELTPTLKVKRKIVEQNYADTIEGFYSE